MGRSVDRRPPQVFLEELMKRLIFALCLFVTPVAAQEATVVQLFDLRHAASTIVRTPFVAVNYADSAFLITLVRDSAHVIIDRTLYYSSDTTVAAWRTHTYAVDSVYKAGAGYSKLAFGGSTIPSGVVGMSFTYRFKADLNTSGSLTDRVKSILIIRPR